MTKTKKCACCNEAFNFKKQGTIRLGARKEEKGIQKLWFIDFNHFLNYIARLPELIKRFDK